MSSMLTLIPRVLALGLVASVAFIGQAASAEQKPGCGSLPGELQAAHMGETPIFSGNDHDNRVFTLTQDKKTGAWSLWVITEFKKEAGGLELGKPCIVAAGNESKVLDAGAPENTAINDAPTKTHQPVVVAKASAEAATDAPVEVAVATAAPSDAETYRVTGIAAGEILGLRAGPGTNFPTIVPIPSDGAGVAIGSCKKVKGYRYRWCEASWEGHKGWASACCLASSLTGRRLD
jgi:hypothetical protein